MKEFFTILLHELIIIPAAALCYFPMKNQLKGSVSKIIVRIFLLLLIAVPIMSWVTYHFSLQPNTVLLPMLVLFYVGYHRSLTVSPDRTFAIFAYVCALMSLLCNFANGFDALKNPLSGANTFSMENSLFSLILSMTVTALLFYPVTKYGSILIDRLLLPRVWYTTVLISVLFFSINFLIRPQKYQTLYTNKVFLAFWGSLTMMATTLLLLTVIFYFIVSGILRELETIEKNRILEMQQSQYIKQQNYMQATAAERHNFRQTIRTLESLAEAKDYAAIEDYLRKYVNTMPKNDVTGFCKNHAVNALLNYYAESAKAEQVSLHFVIDIPDSCKIDDTDLCNVIGNLLENAIAACGDVPEEKRFINLYIENPEKNEYLYITMSNSFNGKVRMAKERYLSTRHSGNGIGLSSIASIAEKNGGSARFYHERNVFNADIAMKLAGNSES